MISKCFISRLGCNFWQRKLGRLSTSLPIPHHYIWLNAQNPFIILMQSISMDIESYIGKCVLEKFQFIYPESRRLLFCKTRLNVKMFSSYFCLWLSSHLKKLQRFVCVLVNFQSSFVKLLSLFLRQKVDVLLLWFQYVQRAMTEYVPE